MEQSDRRASAQLLDFRPPNLPRVFSRAHSNPHVRVRGIQKRIGAVRTCFAHHGMPACLPALSSWVFATLRDVAMKSWLRA